MREKLRKLIQERVLDQNYVKNVYDLSPQKGWMFDFRAILLAPAHLETVIEVLWEKIKDLDNFQIGGLESASIPLVTGLVLKGHKEGKNVNGFYIRKSRKKSGLFKHIEGVLNDDPIVLVDDLMNSSSSIMRQVEVLTVLGKKVSEVLVIVRFREKSEYPYLSERKIRIKNIFALDDFGLEDLDKDPTPIKQNPFQQVWYLNSSVSSHNLVVSRPTPLIATDSIFFGVDAGYFLSLNKHTGEEKWKFRTGLHAGRKNILSSAASYDDSVIFGSYDGKLYALDVNTGKLKWVFTDCEWIGSSPAVAHEKKLVFVGLEHGLTGRQGSMIALDVETGERVWEFDMQALTHASPLYIEETGQLCFGGNEGVVYMVNASTGELLWKFETEGGRRYAGTGGFSPGDIKAAPVYDRETDQIAVCSTDGYMYVLERGTGELVFRAYTDYADTDVRSAIFGQPLFTKESVLFAGLDKCCYCYDKKTGEHRWTFATAGRVFASPVIHDGRLFIGSNDGRLYELDAETGAQVTVTQFPERVTTPVVIDSETGMLYVTTNTNEVHALKLI